MGQGQAAALDHTVRFCGLLLMLIGCGPSMLRVLAKTFCDYSGLLSLNSHSPPHALAKRRSSTLLQGVFMAREYLVHGEQAIVGKNQIG